MYDSRTDSDSLSSWSFLENMNLTKEANSKKCSEVENFETQYTCDKKVTSFRRYLNISGTSDDGGIILESCSKVDRGNMISSQITSFLLLYVYVDHSRPRGLISFTYF